jgi:hypothetical protein
MRVRTGDLNTVDRGAEVLTVERIGRTRELTPEGFLLCRDVRIARTGEMLYAPGELADADGKAIEAGRDQIIRVTRGPEELFRPETLASFNGKPVTDDHPDEDVTPENWKDHVIGICLNPRQGEGDDAEFMMADLLVTVAWAIEMILNDEKLEVSNGYDATYEQISPGRARQFDIIGNHVALVDKGRCGPSCSIGDADMKTRDQRRPARTWKDRIMTAFKARDEAALTEAMEMAQDEMTNGVEGEEGSETVQGPARLVIEVKPAADPSAATERQEETTDEETEQAPAWFSAHVEQNNARFEKIEAALSRLAGSTSDEETEEREEERTDDEEAEETEERTDDEESEAPEEKNEGTRDRSRTGDSAAFADAFQDMLARAEILAPGIKLPTFDAKSTAKVTRDRMCAFKRRALVKAVEDEDTAEIIAGVTGKKPDFAKLTCDSVGVMFVAASELVKSANSTVSTVGFVHENDRSSGGALSIADLNQRNREFWKGKGGAL